MLFHPQPLFFLVTGLVLGTLIPSSAVSFPHFVALGLAAFLALTAIALAALACAACAVSCAIGANAAAGNTGASNSAADTASEITPCVEDLQIGMRATVADSDAKRKVHDLYQYCCSPDGLRGRGRRVARLRAGR